MSRLNLPPIPPLDGTEDDDAEVVIVNWAMTQRSRQIAEALREYARDRHPVEDTYAMGWSDAALVFADEIHPDKKGPD